MTHRFLLEAKKADMARACQFALWNKRPPVALGSANL
jgi:hypothetical protein